jgi:hypothetical protein
MRMLRLLLALFFAAWTTPALAEVQIQFYSKDFASTFPHAYVRLIGTDDSTGQAIDTNYGFTPHHLSLAILSRPVQGMIETVDPVYVSRSKLHFSLELTPDQYRTVLAIVDKWRNEPQPNYRLNSHNCVHFVAEVATALGLYAPPVPQLIKKPKSFLTKVTRDNWALIQQWPSRIAVAARPVSARVPATPAQ